MIKNESSRGGEKEGGVKAPLKNAIITKDTVWFMKGRNVFSWKLRLLTDSGAILIFR